MKKIVMLLIVVLIFSACAKVDPVQKMTGTKEEISASFIENLKNKEFESLLTQYTYTTEMEGALNNELFEQLFTQLESSYGQWLETGDFEVSKSGDFDVVSYFTEWENSNLNFNIVFDTETKIAGFNYTEALEAMVTETNITEQEVTFGKEPFVLSGTLSLPAGDKPFPAVILIHGSGPSNRDEAFQELTPFKDIADYLTDNGIAVLRYDKRTFTYGQEIDPVGFTVYEESIEDAIYAKDFLSTQDAIDSSQIYFLGHSLGGYLMPRIASLTPEAAGYIMTAGSALPLEDLIVKQYTYIFNLDGTLSTEESAQIDALMIQQQSIKSLTDDSDLPSTELMGVEKAYWLYMKNYDHLTEVKDIEKPLLILQGEGDYQVTMDDFNLWKESVGDKPNVTMITYPKINHFLYEGTGIPSPAQYSSPKHVDEKLLEDILNFIK